MLEIYKFIKYVYIDRIAFLGKIEKETKINGYDYSASPHRVQGAFAVFFVLRSYVGISIRQTFCECIKNMF